MEMINKIIAYCKEVQEVAAKEANELHKSNEDYDAGKFCVASAVLKIVSEPEPPTVRPMSENSKRKLLKDFLEHVEAEIDYLQCEPSILIDSYIESLLPNPDDIKL